MGCDGPLASPHATDPVPAPGSASRPTRARPFGIPPTLRPGESVMGRVYRRAVYVCTTCAVRLDTTAAHRACMAAGHGIHRREQPTWWIRYRADGREHRV